MKFKGLVFFNIIVLALGIAFLFVSAADRVIELIIAAGTVFILLAITNIALLIRRRQTKSPKGASTGWRMTQASERAQRPGAAVTFIGWLCSIGAAILGIVMVVTPTTFTSFLIYIFSIAIFLGGCYHIYMLSKGIAPVRLPSWTYTFPLVLIVGSVVMFMLDVFAHNINQTTVILAAGIGMIIFAITSFIEIFGYKALGGKTAGATRTGSNRSAESASRPAEAKPLPASERESSDIEDVTATEVK